MVEGTDGGPSPEDLVKVHVFDHGADIVKADGGSKSGTSQQVETVDFASMQNEVITPPYTPEIWAALSEKNTRLGSLITCMALNTVGRGFKIIPVIEGNDINPEIEEEIKRQTKLVRPLFEEPNSQMSFPQLMKRTKVDEESTGNGYLEITRNFMNVPDGIYHIPSHTIRMLKNNNGYVQKRNNTKVYFKKYGDDKLMSAKDGKYYEDPNDVPFEERANELIHFRIYSARSSYYGIPRYVGASAAISGSWLASIRNVTFFENDATPRCAILVSGGQLSDNAAKSIKSFLGSKGKGPENMGRVMVIEAIPKQVGPGKTEAVKIELVPLTIGIEEDASFQKYRTGNDEEIREAFRIGKVLLGTTEGVPKAAAQAQKQVTNEQVFYPEIAAIEYMLNKTIVKDLVITRKKVTAKDIEEGIKDDEFRKEWKEATTLTEKGRTLKIHDDPMWEVVDGCMKEDGVEEFTLEKKVLVRLKFELPVAIDPVDTAKADEVYAKYGALTPNDLREKLGMMPYRANIEWANTPIVLTLQSSQNEDTPESEEAKKDIGELVNRVEELEEGVESDG